MLRRALIGRFTPNLRLRHGKWGITLEWKRPHTTWRFGLGRWMQHGTMPPPGCSWKPWPHHQIVRAVDHTFTELYWPRVGNVTVFRSHRTSYLLGNPPTRRSTR
ncbi:hypothetical protein KNV19_gp79 [Gordonia phage Portcullis]|uniref:Uncharacterized protein n=1 Tax=Gordonia phage Portcullis TaxID=2762414 RepID=A0A7G8LGM1_9CAUD|nr:hypothetical protein KNV19_gp79 [Gordonia phage Portcullis]QNJ56393.1 hypothetical protein SEA_PORTCULLIS_79 [Gordonia phage Portcullis]